MLDTIGLGSGNAFAEPLVDEKFILVTSKGDVWFITNDHNAATIVAGECLQVGTL